MGRLSTSTKNFPEKKASTGKAYMKILNTAAALKATLGKDLDRKQISILTGINGASTIRNGLADLKKQNLAEVTPESVIVTEKGMEEADLSEVDVATIPTTNKDYQENIKVQLKLTSKELEVFDAMANGRVYTKDQIMIAIDGKKNSTFRNLLAGLKKKNIIEPAAEKDSFQLHKDMFPFEARPE